jgi:HD-like signal output (HDOD) protein
MAAGESIGNRNRQSHGTGSWQAAGSELKYSHFFCGPADMEIVTATVNAPNVRDRALVALGKLPPFSPILNRLMASLAHEDVSFAKVADLIEKDTVLAGNILRLVNSALYGLRGTVNSIRHAIALLGIAKLRNATLSMSVARMWTQLKSPAGWSTTQFNLHSVAVAILADAVTQRRTTNYSEGAFAAGLFHDLGQLLVALGLPQEYEQIAVLCNESGKSHLEAESDVLGMTHAELSAEALAVWNLPEPIQTAVRYHNDAKLDPTILGPGEISLSMVLQAADQYVKGLGISVGLIEQQTVYQGPTLESLGLGDDLPTIISEFENEFAAIKPYF